jgi:hypothetical protein
MYPSPFPGKSSRPCLHLEWIPGQTLGIILRSENNSLDFKREAMRNFAAVSGARHARALQLGEPRLLFEHPSMQHVLASGKRLIHLDFEIVFTKKNDLERLIRHEIAGFLYSMSKAGGKHFPALLDAFVSAYPDHARLEVLEEELRRFGTVPLASILKPFPAFFKIFKRYRRISRYVQAGAMPLTHQG